MAKQKSEYHCAKCGFFTLQWFGRCPECNSWGSIEKAPVAVQRAGLSAASIARTPAVAAQPITKIDSALHDFLPTGVAELDRVLGGGCVPGATILFSGEPGVGKSTLLLKAAAHVAAQGARVLYLSGEESTSQIKLRAERTGALHDSLYLAAETDLNLVIGHLESVDPDFLIVDSVQTVASPDVTGIAGGSSQVREVTATLVRAAKSRNMPLMLVGHVTKDGNIAGPRTLEHLVDVVCHFEGDKQSSLRFLRALKNRYGSTDEVGCFTMVSSGIAEVKDPSSLFLSGSDGAPSGSCIAFVLEGKRVLPVEVQALVIATSAPNPRRVTSGIDASRFAMILAVLERRAGVKLRDCDVYVSTVGGIKLTQPGADLAVALAVMSAALDKPLNVRLAAAGELSLTGQVRAAVSAQSRRKEARRLGYTLFLDSQNVASIGAAARAAFGGFSA